MLVGMAIETIPFSARTAGPYTATAGQTAFPFGFPALKVEDLAVWRQRQGEVIPLSLGLHYTVIGTGEQAGGAGAVVSLAGIGWWMFWDRTRPVTADPLKL
jgi:hypothetical protein